MIYLFHPQYDAGIQLVGYELQNKQKSTASIMIIVRKGIKVRK
jgi:accessory gene regulator protein AgrB